MLLCPRHIAELRYGIDEAEDEPGRGDAVKMQVFTGDPMRGLISWFVIEERLIINHGG